MSLSKILLGYVDVVPLTDPVLTINLALEAPSSSPFLALPSPPNLSTQSVRVPNPDLCDVSGLEAAPFELPIIETPFQLQPLQRPRRDGKAYKSGEAVPPVIQAPLLAESDLCKHGITRSTCSPCAQEERHRAEAGPKTLDPFDVIFPILYPPLGDNLDNPIVFPSGKELYPFQREGVRFLAEHGAALLADEMGLGKSIQAIVAMKIIARQGKLRSGLVLCPKSLLSDWEAKLWEWAPELRVRRVQGLKDSRLLQWRTPAHLHLTTYETLRQDIDELPELAFDLTILDEIQKIKNPGTGVAQAARRLAAKARWGLSGTPMENDLDELRAVVSFLQPGLLRGEDSLQTIKGKIAILMLRRRKSDVLRDLPDKVSEDVWLELTPAQDAAYNAAEKDGVVYLKELGQSATLQHVLALITRLKQVCNLDPKSDESCKLEYLVESLEGVVDNDEKALVFSQYPNKTLKEIMPRLEVFHPLLYDGALSSRTRDEYVERFQSLDTHRVLLMSVKSGGLGLTLTRANHVYHYDLWWNPATAQQAEDRAHRIGQRKTVFVTSLLTRDTIEEKIQNILNAKRRLFAEVIDDLSDANLDKLLTEEELFGLFGLEAPSRRRGGQSAGGASPPVPHDVDSLAPEQFEKLVADLYKAMGYETRLTQFSRDGGIDVEAKRQTGAGGELLFIQCKHYPGGTVGVDKARELWGVMREDVSRGVVVTSGTFSQDCRRFAEGKRLELIDGPKLRGLLMQHGLLGDAQVQKTTSQQR